MFDLSLEWNFLTIWLLVMGMVFCYGLWVWRKMKREMNNSRKALENLKDWSEYHPEFRARRAGIDHHRVPDEISDPRLNSKTQKWLKHFWAGHQQNKPPDVDGVIQKEEELLCNNDDTFRMISGSLIILGLLGTFFGLYKVILPIQNIIQNTKDSTTITDPSAAAQSMTAMLKDIGDSLLGMEFAFVTSIGGLLGMLVLNGILSRFSKKRFELIDELETHCNEHIAPRFRLFTPETQWEEAVTQLEAAVNRAFKDLADRHSEFMADQEDYLKRTLEAHFEKVLAYLEPLFQRLKNTSDTLNAASGTLDAASASSQRTSEKWQKTLDDFAELHAKFMADQKENLETALKPLLQSLNRASDKLNEAAEDWSKTFSQGAEAVRVAGGDFVKHISNFTKLSEPLEELKAAVEKMVEGFDKRIEALALTMGETYQVLQKLNPDEPPYQPVFEDIRKQLDAIHKTEQALLRFQQVEDIRAGLNAIRETEQELLRFQQVSDDKNKADIEDIRTRLNAIHETERELLRQVSDDEDKVDIDAKVAALRQSLSSVERAIENFKNTLMGNLTVVNQTLNDFPKVLRQQNQIIGLLEDMDVRPDRPKRLKRLMGKLKGFFKRI